MKSGTELAEGQVRAEHPPKILWILDMISGLSFYFHGCPRISMDFLGFGCI